jgi:ribose 5-phosphate isomerase B
MKIAVASDHRGTAVKSKILEIIRGMGHDALDFGPEGSESVAGSISKTEIDRGVLICGTGIGMCIVANKFNGVRAASVWDDLTAQMSRLHNDANVLCLSADLIGEQSVDRMIDIWLKTEFEGGRHARRVEKISKIEETQ